MSDLQKQNRLRLKVVEKGTHILPFSKWNNDIPSPCECVAEALVDLEFHIAKLVKNGGTLNAPATYVNAKAALTGLNNALNAASKQNWKLELEENTRV
jgi:hypothetical protein